MLDGPQSRRRGRPPKPLDPARSRAAFFGFEIRRLREGLDLSLEDLAKRAGCSAGHLGHLERGEVQASGPLVVALDRELQAKKRLRKLFPGVQLEWAAERHAKRARHHKAKQANSAPPPFTVGARATARPSTITPRRQPTDADTRQDNEVAAPVEHDGRSESPEIGSADVRIVVELENITAGFRRLYHHVSADDILNGVVQHLRTTRLLKNQVAKSYGVRLALNTGEVALLAGRLLSMDKSQHDAASPYYRVALRASAEARDHGLHAVVLGHISPAT
jgi:transcriptional regulator with XRE-family HTH domain